MSLPINFIGLKHAIERLQLASGELDQTIIQTYNEYNAAGPTDSCR